MHFLIKNNPCEVVKHLQDHSLYLPCMEYDIAVSNQTP